MVTWAEAALALKARAAVTVAIERASAAVGIASVAASWARWEDRDGGWAGDIVRHGDGDWDRHGHWDGAAWEGHGGG